MKYLKFFITLNTLLVGMTSVFIGFWFSMSFPIFGYWLAASGFSLVILTKTILFSGGKDE